MEETKTNMQKIVEQRTDQNRIAIEQAIDKGAKIEKCESYTNLRTCCYIKGVFLQKDTDDDTISIVLRFNSEKIGEKIVKAFEPSKYDLEKAAEIKRRELEDNEKQRKEREEA